MNYELLGDIDYADATVRTAVSKAGIAGQSNAYYAGLVTQLASFLGARTFENMVAAFTGVQSGAPWPQDKAVAAVTAKMAAGGIGYPREALNVYKTLMQLKVTNYQSGITLAPTGASQQAAAIAASEKAKADALAQAQAEAARAEAEARAKAQAEAQALAARLAQERAEAQARELERQAQEKARQIEQAKQEALARAQEQERIRQERENALYQPNQSDEGPVPPYQDKGFIANPPDTRYPGSEDLVPGSERGMVEPAQPQPGPITPIQEEPKKKFPWLWVAIGAGALFVLK